METEWSLEGQALQKEELMMSSEGFSPAIKTLIQKENQFEQQHIIISIFSFGANFLITADYVHFRELMAFTGITSSIKTSILLAVALVTLGGGAIVGGVLMDKIKIKWPVRELFILIGTIVAALFILGIAFVTIAGPSFSPKFNLLLILLAMSHFFLGGAYAPWLSFLPLLFTKKGKVTAAISINIFSGLGAAIATISFSKLIDKKMPGIIWFIISGVLILSGVFTAVFHPSKNKSEKLLLRARISIEGQSNNKPITKKSWAGLLLVGSSWAFSSHLVETGLIDSLVNRYNVSSTAAAVSSNILMGGYIILLLVPVFLLTAKVEKFLGGMITSAVYSLFCFLLAYMPKFQWIFFIVFIGGLGNILLSIFQFTLPAESVWRGREGTCLGLFFAFSSITKPLATMIQGVFLEGKEYNQSLITFGGYPWVFLLAAMVMLISIIPLAILKMQTQKKKEKGREKVLGTNPNR